MTILIKKKKKTNKSKFKRKRYYNRTTQVVNVQSNR